MKSAYYLFALGLSFLLNGVCASAQQGKAYPVMEVYDLKDNGYALPNAKSGSFALYGLATTAKAEEQLRTWQAPVYNKFIAKTGLMDQLWDLQVYFIPVFTGSAKAAKASVVKKLKANNEKLVVDHLLIYTGSSDVLEPLDMRDKKIPYFFLVDQHGKIVWERSGPFRQKYMEEITDILSS